MLPSSFLLDLLRLISANTSRYSESLPLMRLGFLGTSRAGKMANVILKVLEKLPEGLMTLDLMLGKLYSLTYFVKLYRP